jgi:hypothetical protein
MEKRILFVLGVVAALAMFVPAAHSAQITKDNGQYDTYTQDWVHMTWGQPGAITLNGKKYTITPKGTGTESDPYRFEVSPEITFIPKGNKPNFSRSFPSLNLPEFKDWVESLPQPSQVPEPSVLAMLLLGLAGMSLYRKKCD